MSIQRIISRIFPKKREPNNTGKYMDSQEFKNALFKAVDKGTQDQAKFMKSMGAKWD